MKIHEKLKSRCAKKAILPRDYSALKVARAAEAVIAGHFTQGFKELDAMRAKYGSAPWYKDIHGNYTYLLLPYSETQLG